MESQKNKNKTPVLESLLERPFPILEYDPDSRPIIEAKFLYDKARNRHGNTRCLFTYFQDVVEKYEQNDKLYQVFRLRTEGVRPRVYEKDYINAEGKKERIYIVPVPLGAPIAARMIESMEAMGCNKFMVCGGAGSLHERVNTVDVLVPVAAVRDEGTSYHYLPPSREVFINQNVLEKIRETLNSIKEPFIEVKTWTTDGSFRETEDKVALRKSEGCSTVEMECAAYLAVAQHKKLMCGQLLYAGDIVKKEGWEYRNWHSKIDIREKLFELAIKCLIAL